MGGAETWLLALLRYWRQRGGPQVEFLLTNGREEVLDSEARALGARLHYLTFTRRAPLRFFLGFRQLLESGGFRALHDHCDLATGLHFAVAGSTLPPIRIAHFHNHHALFAENYLTSPTRRALAVSGRYLIRARATHVLATSRGTLEGFGFSNGRGGPPFSRVLHCGIDPQDYRRDPRGDRARLLSEFGWPGDSLVALCVGRLDLSLDYPNPTNNKNTAFALDVARTAASISDRFRLLVIGEGPSRAQFEQRVAGWGLDGKIRFTGLRRDLQSLMVGSNVLLFPSVAEALGMVVVEAQAAGLRVLASDEISREAVIVPELYSSLPLSAPVEEWARHLLDPGETPTRLREHCLGALEASPFNVAYAARVLEGLYATGSMDDPGP